MFSPVFIRALIYTGIVYNTLGIIVFLILDETTLIPERSGFLLMWMASYLLHKKLGTW